MNWDLSVFYKGFDDPQIERDFARCDEITVEKQAVLKQGLSVRETLEKYMALAEEQGRTGKYAEYASLSLSTDATNTAAMQLMDRAMQQDVADRMAGAAFSRYLGSLSDEAFEQAIAESEQLQAVNFSLRQDRAAAKHLPAPEIQEWLLKMSLTGSRAFSQLRDKLDATLSVDYRGEKLPLSAVRGKAEDPDPQVRYDAYKAELAAYPQIEQAMAACLNGIKGEALTLAFAPGVYLRGTVEIRHCGEVWLQAASLGDACVYPTGAQTPVTARAVQRLTLKSLYLSGYRGRSTATDGSEYCVQAQGCNTVIDGCGMEYSRSACLYAAGGTASMHACLGGCTGDNPATNANLGYAARGAEGAHIALEDTYPLAFIAHYCGSSMATYRVGTGCVGTAGGMSEPGSARVTRTFLPSFHCTYTGSSRKAYPNNKVIWQGVYGQYRAGYNNFNTGTLWFDEASAALAGKTIHQATLSLRRSNGGSSAARNVYLGAVALRQAEGDSTYRPAFTAPSALPAYPAGQLSRECEGVYDITSLMAAVQQGYGIGVYEPCAAYSGSYSPHYTMFYGLGSE